MDETASATRTTYRTIILQLGALLGVLLVIGGVAGQLIAGLPGIVGVLMAAALAVFFMGTTVVTMMATTEKPLHVATAAFAFGWVAKVLVLFGVLVMVRGKDFYHPGVFFAALTVAVIGASIIEMRAVWRARIPVTGTGGPDAS